MSSAVTCLGHRDRGDDAVGPLVAERLRERGIAVLDCQEEPTRLLDAMVGLDLLVIVDAVRSGGPPGTLVRIEARDEPLPADLGFASTHAFGIAEALELARALDRAPACVVVHGVAGERFGMGDEPTPAVVAALDPLVDRVVIDLGQG